MALCYNTRMSLSDAFFKAADYMLGTGQRGNIFPKVEPKPVRFDRALEIFDEIAAMGNIAFGFPDEGCFSRAHMMVRQLYEMGETPKKAWAFEPEGGDLLVKLSNGKEITWWSHVAAALPVEMPDGKVLDLVYDPSMFNGPVTLQQWGKAMGAPPHNLMFADAGRAARGQHGDYTPWNRTSRKTDDLANDDMMEYLPLQYVKESERFESPLRKQWEKLLQDEYLRTNDPAAPAKPAEAQPVLKKDLG